MIYHYFKIRHESDVFIMLLYVTICFGILGVRAGVLPHQNNWPPLSEGDRTRRQQWLQNDQGRQLALHK
jgi:hypothetical protein